MVGNVIIGLLTLKTFVHELLLKSLSIRRDVHEECTGLLSATVAPPRGPEPERSY